MLPLVLFFSSNLLQPKPPDDGPKTEVLVLHNEHNAAAGNSGAKVVNIILGYKGKPVWEQKAATLNWAADKDASTTFAIPKRRYDIIRVEIVEWHGNSGGLAEIELWQRGKNLARGKAARASKPHREGDRRVGQNVTDGIASSGTHEKGYWILPDGEEGWVEIYLTKDAPGTRP